MTAGGGVSHSTALMFLYQAVALLGSAAKAETSERGRVISISVSTSTATREVFHRHALDRVLEAAKDRLLGPVELAPDQRQHRPHQQIARAKPALGGDERRAVVLSQREAGTQPLTMRPKPVESSSIAHAIRAPSSRSTQRSFVVPSFRPTRTVHDRRSSSS